MKLENRLHDYKERIENYKLRLEQEREAKKDMLNYHNTWIQFYKRRIKVLQSKYEEIKRSKNGK